MILAGNVAVLVWSITGVEPMLCKNSITNVNSLAATGQLIPFIIGVATVAKLDFNAMTEDYEPPLLIWSFFVSVDHDFLRVKKLMKRSSTRSRKCLMNLRGRALTYYREYGIIANCS